jgi:hypothetical protein
MNYSPERAIRSFRAFYSHFSVSDAAAVVFVEPGIVVGKYFQSDARFVEFKADVFKHAMDAIQATANPDAYRLHGHRWAEYLEHCGPAC